MTTHVSVFEVKILNTITNSWSICTMVWNEMHDTWCIYSELGRSFITDRDWSRVEIIEQIV